MNFILRDSGNREFFPNLIKDQAESFAKQSLGIERELLTGIKSAVQSQQILVISGLRRVGKSTLLRQIAERYFQPKQYYYLNFEDERFLNFTAADFEQLHETLIGLFGPRQVIFLDEIQNVSGWERFVRRLHDRGHKLIITGSNAALLSQELGTRLTGRYLKIELYPFSFREYLVFKKPNWLIDRDSLQSQPPFALTTVERGRYLKQVRQYLQQGGLVNALQYPDLPIQKSLYADVLYRDVASRYKIDNVLALKELSLYLLSNVSKLVSFNKLKNLLKLGSTNTVKNYVDYLQSSYLFFLVNKFAASVKEQQIAVKKVYTIDLGLISAIAFAFSDNFGQRLENLVFLELKRRYTEEIYYYKTQAGSEVDFYLPQSGLMVQVCADLSRAETKSRELKALAEAKIERNIKKQVLINWREQDLVEGVEIIPLYQWLLQVN